MTSAELVLFEIEQFKKGWGKKIDFSEITAININSCISHALSDALNQGSRRRSLRYKPVEEKFYLSFSDVFKDVAEGKKLIVSNNDFKILFSDLKERFFDVLKENNLEPLATFGFAQKFISMSFKYIYCFNGSKKENFKFCYLPLDQYTINWYKQYGSKRLVDQFKKINYAWSKINEELFFKIQETFCNTQRAICHKIIVQFFIYR